MPTAAALSRLATLRAALIAFTDGVEDDGVARLARRPARWVGLPAAPALGRATQLHMLRHSITLREFLLTVLLPTVECALQFHAIFTAAGHSVDGGSGVSATSPGDRVRLNAPTAAFTRREVWCLLANMLLCTLPSRTDPESAEPEEDETDVSDGEEAAALVEARLLPTADYTEMVSAPEGANEVEVTKLQLLFDFLADAASWSAAQATETELTVHRCRASTGLARGLLPKVWCVGGSDALALPALAPLVLHALGEGIDDQQAMVRLDFANKYIGGGALADGAVQEEITFAQCPGLNTLRWNHTRLEHAESLAVTNYRQYGRVKAGTYGGGIRYGEPVSPSQRCGGALLAVDALDFRYNSVDEYSRAAVYREVMKLVSGLTSPAVRDVTCVAGGNWGCGVFGGDYELKCLVQWVACGIAGKRLHYFPFDNPAYAAFAPRLAARFSPRCTPPLTTANLLSFLYSLEDASDEEGNGAVAQDVADTEGAVVAAPAAAVVAGFVWRAFERYFHVPADE